MNEQQQVSSLVSEETLKALGARPHDGVGRWWRSWVIDRPKFIEDSVPTCFLVVWMDEAGRCTVTVGPKMLDVRAVEHAILPADIDATVVRLCLSRYGREVLAS